MKYRPPVWKADQTEEEYRAAQDRYVALERERRRPRDLGPRAGPVYQRAVENIRHAMRECGANQKQVALSISMSEAVFSQKLKGLRSHLFLEEMEQIAVYLRGRLSRPLTGFPHIEWTLMERIDREVGGGDGVPERASPRLEPGASQHRERHRLRSG
jgi:hypothetical protein